MKTYNVFWKENKIGTLYVKEGRYKYDVEENVIQKLKNEPICPAVLRSYDWGEPIPFFELRINLGLKYDIHEVALQTDFVKIKEVV